MEDTTEWSVTGFERRGALTGGGSIPLSSSYFIKNGINMNKLNRSVLILNNGYEPMGTCDAKKAITLVYLAKAMIVEEDEAVELRSPNTTMYMPSVIRLSSYVHLPYKKLQPSKRNVFKRDKYVCQYCGIKCQAPTVDHVIPKSRGGKNTWTNMTTSCFKCNNKKNNRTPVEANMKLLSKPFVPSRTYIIGYQNTNPNNEDWKKFLNI